MINSVFAEKLITLEKEFASYRSAERKIQMGLARQDKEGVSYWKSKQYDALNRFYGVWDKLFDEITEKEDE